MTQFFPSWISELVRSADRDEAVVRLGKRFLDATDAERQLIYDNWDFGAQWPYPSVKRLTCLKGERFEPRERIIASLMLDSLFDEFVHREALIGLSATFRSCELAGLAPAELFGSVGAVLIAPHAEILSAFIRRVPKDRRLSAFGLMETVNHDGEIEITYDPDNWS